MSQVATLRAAMAPGTFPEQGTASIIKTVDGRDVSALDSYFELSPGCHVVKTEDTILWSSGRTQYVGERVFSLRMRAGFDYAVVVQYLRPLGVTKGDRSITPVKVYSVERNAIGAETQTIDATSGAGDVNSCQAWSSSAA